MTAVIKTTWVKTSKKRLVNLQSLKITDDPYVGRRVINYRYDFLFNKLKYGQSISCEKANVGTICNALRDYLRRHGKKGKVRSVEHFDETTGRVWLLEA